MERRNLIGRLSFFDPKWEQENDILVEEKVKKQKAIILHNDDVNNFEHVIVCLVDYCEHSLTQAEQCALLVHNNGRCDVKRGETKKLKPILQALLDKGLSATIEEV